MNVGARKRTIHVVQGDFAVSREQDVVFSAVLGSCVAACIFDLEAKIGGMNHFLLPSTNNSPTNPVIFGVQSMELLINDLLKQGARKSRLQAKLFGGANVLKGANLIGVKNAEFAETFLRNEKISCISQSLRGTQARRVNFWPTTGRAFQKFMGHASIVKPAAAPEQKPEPSVELF